MIHKLGPISYDESETSSFENSFDLSSTSSYLPFRIVARAIEWVKPFSTYNFHLDDYRKILFKIFLYSIRKIISISRSRVIHFVITGPERQNNGLQRQKNSSVG